MTRHARSRSLHAVAAALLGACLASAPVRAQEVPLEYQVKAVYLFNFVKFVRWPTREAGKPLTICVAERNPFGDSLQEALRGELVEEREVKARVIRQPEADCDVLFIPSSVDPKPYLAAARGSSTLTVGEEPNFLARGGIVNFIHEAGSVRFEIDAAAAARAELRVSSHLLRLARGTGRRG